MFNYLESKKFKYKTKPVVLITGCASGIGKALISLLYKTNQFRVVATVRSESSLLKLKNEMSENENFLIRCLDVTNSKQRISLLSEVFNHWKSIDILVNNAGISYRSVIEHMDEQSELKQLDVNYLGPLALIRLVVPSMRERGFGKIINISSVSGMIAMPTMASYSASKHALEGATEALWYELRPYGIVVSLIQPGFIKSNSFEKVYFSDKANLSRDLDGPYAECYKNMGPFVEKLMKRSMTAPEDIARKILNLIDAEKPPLWVPVTLDASMFFWLRKILPRSLFHKFMYMMLPNISEWGVWSKKDNYKKVS